MIEDIRYLRLFRVEHLFIDNKLVFNLDPLVFVYRGDAIREGIKVCKLDCL
jgi:hypothetical protein